jgi:uncharacterized protein YjdB
MRVPSSQWGGHERRPSGIRIFAPWSIVGLGIVLVGLACSDSSGPSSSGPATITLSSTRDTLRYLGQSRQFAATVKDKDGTVLSTSVIWGSANPNVATVSADGFVTAVAAGSTRITARIGQVSGGLDLVVRQVPAQVTLTPPTEPLASIGATVVISAVVADSGGAAIEPPGLVWSSSDNSIATVSAAGVAKAFRNGTVTITAAAGGVSGTVPLTVSQVPAQITLAPGRIRLTLIGATASVTPVVRDSGGTVIGAPSITWSNSNTAAVNLSPAGMVTALAFDTATITATATPASASIVVHVSRVVALQVGAPTPDMNEGATLQLSATPTDAGGAPVVGLPVTWVSDSTHLATVSAGGLVQAARTGVVRIRAEVEGLEDTLDIRVRGLIHRWTFSEQGGPGTVFRDDIGGLQARLRGSGVQPGTAVAGVVTLTGGPWATADFVELPPRLFRSQTDMTIEIWGTLHSYRDWSAVFTAGPTPINYLGLIWSMGTSPLYTEFAWAWNSTKTQIFGGFVPWSVDVQHHIVLTIDEGGGTGGTTRVIAYRDGVLVGMVDTDHQLRGLEDDVFWLGRSFSYAEIANASYEEVSLHDRVQNSAEVRARYVQGPVRATSPTTLSIRPPQGIGDTVRGVSVRFPVQVLGHDALGRQFPIPTARWTSSDTTIATVDSVGVVRTRATGQVVLTAAVGTSSIQWVTEVVRIRRVTVDPYLANPIAGALSEVPVILVEYLPTSDGSGLDTLKAPDFYYMNPISLDAMEARILTFAKRRKMMVEEGSRFRGYRDPTAQPSLGYRVVEHIIVYDQIPPHPTKRHTGIVGHPKLEDWHAVFSDLQLAPLIQASGVRELWVAWSAFDGSFPLYKPGVFNDEDMMSGWESNMSSPTTGDISNSDRDPNDVPVFSHTYIIYGINYRRSQAEAVHNVGHQLEAMFSHISHQQDGNDHLFWRNFVGVTAANVFGTGRAGWTHMPPNTTGNYDYLNPTLVSSDIEDWRPDNAGQKKLVNVDTWGTLTYPWPGAPDFSQRVESQWYTYWFQNMPGRGNVIPHGANWMTNWWTFVANWDAAITSGLGLYSTVPAATRGSGMLSRAPRALGTITPRIWTPDEHLRPGSRPRQQ